MGLRLRPFTLSDQSAARAAHDELTAEGFAFLLAREPQEPWAAYVQSLWDHRRGSELPPGWVPHTFLAADVDGVLVGRVSIRHELDEWLENFGGHIGYAVRPDYRRRGFATEILRQALVVARAEGVEEALLTCNDDNVVSAKIIERVGGELEDVRTEPGGKAKRRYWIR